MQRNLSRFGPRFVLAVSLCLAPLASGCSAFTVNQPPPEENWSTLQCEAYCTDGYVAPVVDIGISAILLGSVGALLVSTGFHVERDQIAGVTMASAMGAAAVGSTVYGFLSVDNCREYLAYSRENPPLFQGDGSNRPVPKDLPRVALTVGEAASLTGLSEETIEGWIEDGELAAVETVEGVRISRPALEEAWRAKGGGELYD